jgi:hypothetical protein
MNVADTPCPTFRRLLFPDALIVTACLLLWTIHPLGSLDPLLPVCKQEGECLSEQLTLLDVQKQPRALLWEMCPTPSSALVQ